LFIWLFDLFSWKVAIRRTPLLRKLQRSVYEINAFFSISLLVASIVRWRQAPSVTETVLISYVVWTQLLILTTMLFGQLCDNVMNKANLAWYWQLYYLMICIAQLATSCVVEVPHPDIYQNLAKQCHHQYGFVNLSSLLPASEKGLMTLKWDIIGALGGFALAIIGGACAKVLLKFTPAWLRKHGEITFLITILLLNIMSAVFNAVMIKSIRDVLRELSGDQLPDNGWSYGQITAILLWAPFFWGIVKETFSQYSLRGSILKLL
jgi:hypothetical protein